MLCLHIPALLGFPESAEIPPVTQTAALLGIGLLYQGTAHRLMTEVLLEEIGWRPTNDKYSDREGYSLAAGLGLGLVMLERGSNAVGLGDLHLENRLSQYIVGGKQSNHASNSEHLKCSTIKEGDMRYDQC